MIKRLRLILRDLIAKCENILPDGRLPPPYLAFKLVSIFRKIINGLPHIKIRDIIIFFWLFIKIMKGLPPHIQDMSTFGQRYLRHISFHQNFASKLSDWKRIGLTNIIILLITLIIIPIIWHCNDLALGENQRQVFRCKIGHHLAILLYSGARCIIRHSAENKNGELVTTSILYSALSSGVLRCTVLKNKNLVTTSLLYSVTRCITLHCAEK